MSVKLYIIILSIVFAHMALIQSEKITDNRHLKKLIHLGIGDEAYNKIIFNYFYRFLKHSQRNYNQVDDVKSPLQEIELSNYFPRFG